MLLGGCDIETTFCGALISIRPLQKEARATITVHKVRNLLCEQKQLESCATDSDSLVRQVEQTLSSLLSSRSGHVQP